MARVLLLIPTTSYNASDFLRSATRLGVEVVIGSNADAFLPGFFGQSLYLDFEQPHISSARIIEFSQLTPLNAIIPTDESTTAVAALAAKALGLRHNTPDSVLRAGNKLMLRECLKAANIPAPSFVLLNTDTNASNVARELIYPCVLKPLSLSASRGVIRADGHNSFVTAFHRIRELLFNVNGTREEKQGILVEDYIHGHEVALEGIVNDGELIPLALFDKCDPLEGPFFAETIYTTPSRLKMMEQKSILRVAQDAITAMKLCEGPIHAELRLSQYGPVVIEVAARSIGGLCSRALRFGEGMALEEIILRHALNITIESFQRESKAKGVMMLPVPGDKAGRLKKIDGMAEAQLTKGINEITITVPLGEIVIPLPEGNRYLGFIFASGQSPDQVESSLRLAYSNLDFIIEYENL